MREPIEMEFEMCEDRLTLENLKESFRKELEAYYPQK